MRYGALFREGGGVGRGRLKAMKNCVTRNECTTPHTLHTQNYALLPSIVFITINRGLNQYILMSMIRKAHGFIID